MLCCKDRGKKEINMTIKEQKAVASRYTLKDETGEILDTNVDTAPLEYLHGAGNLIPGLEKELEGKNVGDKIQAVISPEDAYGSFNEDLVQDVPLTQFDQPDQAKPGNQFHFDGPNGVGIATVVSVDDKNVKVDLNHPLVDKTLNFDVEVLTIRDASQDEIDNGYIQPQAAGASN